MKNINLSDEKERSIYFHELSEDSRSLELLLNTCYKYGIIPSSANCGRDREILAYVVLKVNHEKLDVIGRLIDLVSEIPNCEFNIQSKDNELFVELSCESIDNEQLFTRMNEIIEENIFEKKHAYNYTVMSTIYNISKIIKEVIDCEILFATNENLYKQGKCGVSIYKDKQKNKINMKNADDMYHIIEKLKRKHTLHLPTVMFCTFEELRNFYFELDEIVYSKDIEGENDGQ